MMNIFYWLVALQIVAESLPISSSGHVALCAALLGCGSVSLPFLANVPTLFIVPFFFWSQWVPIFKNWRRTWPFIVRIAGYTFLTDCITALWYLFFMIYPMSTPLFFGFSITACALISLYWCTRSDSQWSITSAVIIGCVQGIALLPGISRLGLTFVAARWLGISSRRSFQISWLIMWPLVGADTLKMVAKGIMSGSNEQLLNLPLALVILVSSIASWYGMEVMLKMVNRNKVHYFGWYMLIPILCALMI